MVVNVVLKNDDLFTLCCVHWDNASACANNILLDLTSRSSSLCCDDMPLHLDALVHASRVWKWLLCICDVRPETQTNTAARMGFVRDTFSSDCTFDIAVGHV